MELHHFRCFIVLSEEMNFRRAADRLHISQPHLTRLIVQLEKDLGVVLLHRTTRRITLTVAGETFLTEAKAVLARVEQAIQVTQEAAEPIGDRLGIAFTEMARHTVVPKILSAFRDRYPHVQLDILEACTEEQVKALHDSKVDIGFLHPPLRSELLEVLPIYQERFMLALPIDHKLATKSAIAIADLADETLILYQRKHGPVLYDYILRLCYQVGFTPKIYHLKPEQTLLSLVTAKIGVCFIPPSLQQASNSGVVCLPMTGEAPVLDHAIAWHPKKSPVVAAFLEIALSVGSR